MICTSVVPCLSSGSANYVYVCPIFQAFLAILRVWLSVSKKRRQTLHQIKTVKEDVLSQFLKIQQLSNNIAKNRFYFDQK